MKKIVVIGRCEDCPFFNHDDQTVEKKWGKSWCEKLDKELDYEFSKSSIPADCPLENAVPAVTDEKEIRLYAILTTEADVASLKRKGKIKPETSVKDAYYEGLVKGLTLRNEDRL